MSLLILFEFRLWVEMYAKNQIGKKVQEIVEMGFTEDQAKIALEKNGFDIEKTVNYLLSNSYE